MENVHRLVHFKGDEPVDESSPGIRTTLPTTIDGVPHLSLTRPMYLRAHQRDILKEAVKEVANKVPRCAIGLVHPLRSSHRTVVLRFSASFTSFVVLDNDTKTRSFLAIEIGAGYHLVSRNESGLSTSDDGSVKRCANYSNQPWECFDNLIIMRTQGFICRLHGC